ncbi:CRISPR-associated protein Cas1 [Neisseria arctica]|uniref:CRISPR-associated endonuclease Cas1 n=1 Tax=Neisseria arctica TaxID=1470200 RepID=A0A0J1C1R5_9NEIS|nr:type II CRISPR-associated endonuclease Cas1 [Neisseria arctica]KLT72213.1 CRISPR-associated protein Cas1 [Neisseria arctica]UOO86686.1 type II CRISPR-associated endonuclease Cas1 [Neisseria arctica]
MSWRSLLIREGGKLSLKHKQLLIQQNGESYTVPLEDIAVIVIESPDTVLTVPLLSALACEGVTLFTCDEQFLPCGQWLPYAQYHRQLKTLKLQLNMTEPQKKQLWQAIIKQKICNQAKVADETGNDFAAKRLRAMAVSVKSGDSGNMEAQAAALYFQAIYGSRFKRWQESPINIHLNYGYAVLRAAIARALVQYGWLPALGLFHKSELNPFNLADDFIEPYRPLADLMVWHLYDQSRLKESLDRVAKQNLVALLNHQISLDGQTFSVLASIDRTVASFQNSIVTKQARLLKLPEILPLKEHFYE